MAPLGAVNGDLGDESGSRRALSCVCPFSSCSSSEERALWVPVMGEHQRGAVLLPVPEGFRIFCPSCFLRFLRNIRRHRWGTEGEGAAAALAGLGGSRSWGFLRSGAA